MSNLTRNFETEQNTQEPHTMKTRPFEIAKSGCGCGRCQQCIRDEQDAFSNLLEELENLGFALIGTGGNCEAYRYEADGYEWLLTDREAGAPADISDSVGLYCMKGGACVGSWLADSLSDLLEQLEAILQDAPRWQGRTAVETGTGEAFTEEI